MGRSYLFECPRCSFKAHVSGGPDTGVALRVQTILCRECRTLYDAVTTLKTPRSPRVKDFFGFPENRDWRRQRPAAAHPPSFESAVNRLFLTGNAHSRWVRFKLRCPVSSAHHVRPWNEPDRCPKCGTYLEKNALPFRIWE